MTELTMILALSVGLYLLSRFINRAAQQSAREELQRKIVKEYLRQRRIDELYGRERDNEKR